MSLRRIGLKRGVFLKQLTAIKIGGRAYNFYSAASVADIKEAFSRFGNFYILGAGSNILASDKGVSLPILKLGRKFNYISRRGNEIEIGAATPLSEVIKYCGRRHISGWENLAGIPALVGGMLANNASCRGAHVSDGLLRLEAVDKNCVVSVLKKDDIIFNYRSSSLKGAAVILRAWFIAPGAKDVASRAAANIAEKIKEQDYRYPSCGCVFKNPPGKHAGRLIDSCGLKGLRCGGAQVSEKHANFIINVSKATRNDVELLIARIKKEVFGKYGISLQEEIERWG